MSYNVARTEHEQLVEQCRDIIQCDTARISKPGKTMFLIIGFNHNTKEDKNSQWIKNGEPTHFDYVQESVVAFGKTKKELIDSCLSYKKLCGMTMLDILNDEDCLKMLDNLIKGEKHGCGNS